MFYFICIATTAISHLISPTGKGEVLLSEQQDGVVTLDGFFEGLTPGRHVLQLHAEGCSAILKKGAGAHFNPVPTQGCDSSLAIVELAEFEASVEGKATIASTIEGIYLSGSDSIVGHSLVLHSVGLEGTPSCGRIEME